MSARPMDVRQAAAVLYLHRHRLSPDILRTIQAVWVCASAARYSGPYETRWAQDPDVYSGHEVSECEADDDTELADAIRGSAETAPPVNLPEIARQLERELWTNRRPEITDVNQLDVQALCAAEEARELAGAYRRHAGKARRSGTLREPEDEVAGVLIVTAVFAGRAGIDIDAAVTRKLAVTYSRGWRQVPDE